MPLTAQAVRERVRVPGGDPGDVRRMTRLVGVERLVGVLPRRTGWGEGTGHDHLRGRVRGLALREPVGHRVPVGIEKRMPLVDAVVDDPDLDPGAGVRQRRRREALVPGSSRRRGRRARGRSCSRTPVEPRTAAQGVGRRPVGRRPQGRSPRAGSASGSMRSAPTGGAPPRSGAAARRCAVPPRRRAPAPGEVPSAPRRPRSPRWGAVGRRRPCRTRQRPRLRRGRRGRGARASPVIETRAGARSRRRLRYADDRNSSLHTRGSWHAAWHAGVITMPAFVFTARLASDRESPQIAGVVTQAVTHRAARVQRLGRQAAIASSGDGWRTEARRRAAVVRHRARR